MEQGVEEERPGNCCMRPSYLSKHVLYTCREPKDMVEIFTISFECCETLSKSGFNVDVLRRR